MRVPRLAAPKQKPRITRKMVFVVDEREGVVRVECRTNLITLTRKQLGIIITEFLYQRGALPSDPRPEPDELDFA